MNRVLIIVEGSTERAVVEQVFAPHFGGLGVSLHAKVVGKPGHKGGIRSFDSVGKEVTALLNQERASWVSTFFDYYGLPTTWPGISETPGKPAHEKARIVETAMLEALRSVLSGSANLKRFLPYVQMHELEALLLSSPQIMATSFERPGLASSFAEIVRRCGECEEIDDNPDAAPSRRIAKVFPGYRKGGSLIAHAPIIATRIGLDAIRRACPHFNAWMTKLERLGTANSTT